MQSRWLRVRGLVGGSWGVTLLLTLLSLLVLLTLVNDETYLCLHDSGLLGKCLSLQLPLSRLYQQLRGKGRDGLTDGWTDEQTGRVTFFFMASSCSFIAKHFFVLSIASLSSYSERQHTVSVAHPLTLGLNRGGGRLRVWEGSGGRGGGGGPLLLSSQ